MYVVRKTRSGQDRNLICFKITHLATTQLTSFFLAALINVKIRIEEGQNFVRVVHQKTMQTQPTHWQVYNVAGAPLFQQRATMSQQEGDGDGKEVGYEHAYE